MAKRKPSLQEREVEFQQDLYFVLREFITATPEVNGIAFEAVRMEYPVPTGEADVVVLQNGQRPFLVIETKRKDGPVQKDIDPMSPKVIDQAIRYAFHLGAPYFATANKTLIAVFRMPGKGEPFDIGRHRVFIEPVGPLNREFAARLLTRVTEYERADVTQKVKIATAVDWAFVLRLRSFVDWLTRRIYPALKKKLAADKAFASRVAALAKETGSKLEAEQLAREMAYILTNKLVFYKALERQYSGLQKLRVDQCGNVKDLLDHLKTSFAHATFVTGDFEAIFAGRVYSEVPLADASYPFGAIVEGVQGFLEDMERYKLESLESDVIGHVYEDLIPPEERHVLGQVYTPPAVAEFLTGWAVRSPEDTVLDPAQGSGTFLVKAYQRLRVLKSQQGLRAPPGRRHKEILDQLYGVDINPFPTQLTAMNLAIRDVRHPVTDMNIIEKDFFQLSPGHAALVPYTVKTANGETTREVTVPQVDALLANPPYTRWTELGANTQAAINIRLGSTLDTYEMRARIRGGVETALYQHFVMNAHAFLKEGGRCAMIISNSWLQTDVGVKFAQFLKDHYRIHGVIDLGPRIFSVALVGANMLLLEKCSDESMRNQTQCVFAYIDRPFDVDDYRSLIEHPAAFEGRDGVRVKVLDQSELPKDRKWVEVLFGNAQLDKKIAGKTIPLKKIYQVMRGTIQYCADESRGLGAVSFFFMDQARADKWRLPAEYLKPTLPGSRDAKSYTITPADWRSLHKQKKDVWAFHAHKPYDDLPTEVRNYIHWGDTECKNRDGVAASDSGASKERANRDGYMGWYDVGEIYKADVWAPYYNTFAPRFALMEIDLALDSQHICLRPKKALSEVRKLALLACLNSTLCHRQLELSARQTGGGALGLETGQVEELRIPDIPTLPKVHVTALAAAFQKLEATARELGSVNTRENYEKIKPHIKDLDRLVAKALKLTNAQLQDLWDSTELLMKRRTIRAPEPQPEFIKGLTPLMVKAPKQKKRASQSKRAESRRLDEF